MHLYCLVQKQHIGSVSEERKGCNTEGKGMNTWIMQWKKSCILQNNKKKGLSSVTPDARKSEAYIAETAPFFGT